MESFKLNAHYSVVCEWKKTRNGFKHEAMLLRDGTEIGAAKVCYLNRTWESYKYQTVIQKLLAQQFDKAHAKNYEEAIRKRQHARTESNFRTVAGIAQLGKLFGKNPKEKNDWKTRMLKAGLPSLDIPDDWDTLNEDEKGRRLDAVINHLGGRT